MQKSISKKRGSIYFSILISNKLNNLIKYIIDPPNTKEKAQAIIKSCLKDFFLFIDNHLCL
jgi:hypothetical protein